MRAITAVVLGLVVSGCAEPSSRPEGSGSGIDLDPDPDDAATGGIDPSDSATTTAGEDPAGSGGPGDSDPTAAGDGGAPVCDGPDVLLVLDRTMSMHRRPDGSTPAATTQSKWHIAIEAVHAFANEFDDAMRLGLELFPVDPGGGACVTLQQRIAGTTATNPGCQGGELLTAPAMGNAPAFAGGLDPLTTLLCDTTPIGNAITDAQAHLSAVADGMREQFVVLVTDGNDTCGTGARAAVADLAAEGIATYVVGFGQSALTDGHRRLNRMACAGRTATDFDTRCEPDGGGGYDAVNPGGATLYLAAEDGVGLADALAGVASTACCGSACVP